MAVFALPTEYDGDRTDRGATWGGYALIERHRSEFMSAA
jgi:hypothetical protein